MRKAPGNPDPTKRRAAFLSNHREVIAVMDFFTVPTLMRRQSRSRKTSFDRARWCLRSEDTIAVDADELGPHMPDDLEALGDVFKLFRNIFAEVSQLGAAVGAAVTAWSVRHDFARKMIREWLALGTRLGLFTR
jgi:hypothetical protein